MTQYIPFRLAELRRQKPSARRQLHRLLAHTWCGQVRVSRGLVTWACCGEILDQLPEELPDEAD